MSYRCKSRHSCLPLGTHTPTPVGRLKRLPVRVLSFLMNSCTSCQLTFSTGRSSTLELRGVAAHDLLPFSLGHLSLSQTEGRDRDL